MMTIDARHVVVPDVDVDIHHVVAARALGYGLKGVGRRVLLRIRRTRLRILVRQRAEVRRGRRDGARVLGDGRQ
jgi:hypothetical protein